MEVLSPSTQAYDRGEKFEAYKTLPTLQEYVLVSSDQDVVEVFTREAPRIWKPVVFTGASSVVLTSIHVTLPLHEIFDGVLR